MNESRNEPLYTEWVLPNWTSFLPTLIIYPTLWLTFVPINVAAGVWSGLILTVAVIASMFAKSARISVTPEALAVKNAQIDRKFITAVESIDGEKAFFERGSGLDTRAWIHFQSSVKTLVKVSINDPEDPTPYWLFSSRNPEVIRRSLGF